jgi:hypothetical protein
MVVHNTSAIVLFQPTFDHTTVRPNDSGKRDFSHRFVNAQSEVPHMKEDRSARRWMTMPELFVVIWVITVMAMLILPAVDGASSARRRASPSFAWLRSVTELDDAVGLTGFGSDFLAIVVASGTIAGTLTLAVAAVRWIIPGSWRERLSREITRISSSSSPAVIERFWKVAGGIIVLSILLICGGALTSRHSFQAKLDSLKSLVRPLGGHATNGRRSAEDRLGLSFHGANVSDDDLRQIVEIAQVAWKQGYWRQIDLDLNGTRVTDDGLRQLLALDRKIETIDLRGTQVTSEGVAWLKQSRPNWDIRLHEW